MYVVRSLRKGSGRRPDFSTFFFLFPCCASLGCRGRTGVRGCRGRAARSSGRAHVPEIGRLGCQVSHPSLSQFKGLGKKPIDEQVKVGRLARRAGSFEPSFRPKSDADFFSLQFFMNRYLTEFEGRFAEVLDVSEVFRKIAASDKADTNAAELNEVEFLRFLTTQNRTMTRDQMRKTFASVDFDKSGGISFIEWLVFRYEKTVADLMAPQDPLPAELRAELNQTLEEYQQVR
jgi:hypothetical protein